MRIVSQPPSDREPRRMQPLSVLPVFLSLDGKTALVCGGTDAAAWKAELLEAAGARVRVVAPMGGRGEAMSRLLTREGGRFEGIDAELTDAHFEAIAIAIADAEGDEAAAGRFREAAKRAGASVNVIDMPAFCDFQFGSIVNRSPLVIGVSTAGAAPILAQAIRRKIETLLPATLSAWARLAQKIRPDAAAGLAPGAPRRAFWERFVDRAFGPAPEAHDEADLARNLTALAADPAPAQGSVTLVGAGPGDADLLTLKAVRALQAADVILFDDLVSDDVLDLARREAKRILVGKRGGRPSCKQHEINDMMVKLAQAGRRVVRLKSGDPMIFGRAGEEIERLRAEGIPFSVVPGVTAGVAMAAALGVSLTHRDCAKSVRFITGHSKKGGLPDDIDWAAVADPTATTIFYMGGRTAAAIAERLIAHGLSPAAPVAIATAISRPEQRVAHATLANLPRVIQAIDAAQPVVIGVGMVFGAGAAASAIAAA